MLPSTPSPISQSVSAPTSRLRKRSSVGRPLSSLNRLSNGKWAEGSISDTGAHEEFDWTDTSRQDTQEPSLPEAVLLDSRATGTAKSSWLRRMSTLSSLKSDSLVSTPPRPGSTISMSNGSTANGSTAPILSSSPNFSSGIVPRNKLVKRSASQRALQGSKTLHSTLRRPATSHQRSATLQQRQFNDEGSNQQQLFRRSLPFEDLREDNPSFDDSMQTWRPYFKSKRTHLVKDGFARKRNANGVMNRNELLRSVVPDINELPTLLLATSITPRSSDDTGDSESQQVLDPNRPATPMGFDDCVSPSSDNTMPNAGIDLTGIPRRSFSIAEMFPSPSPSTWKMPRSGSLKRSKGSYGTLHGRRITSAPQPSKIRQSVPSTQGDSSFGTQTRIWSPGRGRDGSHETKLDPSATHERPSSSPLPPLNRSSTFDVDLPNTAPSYPTTPQPENSSSSPKLSGPSSPVPFPQRPVSTSNKSNRPSRIPSDRASTLLGSDNENSRFLSGDEEDGDGRSDTVYDSLRTGATGSSHSGVRRPPIETIFDESPPAGLSKAKLFALQDLETDSSFVESSPKRDHTAEKEPTLPTSVRLAGTCKDEIYPTPVHVANKTPRSPELPSSPPTNPLEIKLRNRLDLVMDDIQDNETWSFEDPGNTNGDFGDGILESPSDNRFNRFPASSRFQSTISKSTNPELCNGQDRSKQNIFDWSEQPVVEKASPQGSSPRPKTVHGKQSKEPRGSRLSGRRGPSALHLRSQSVPVPPEASVHRGHNNTHKLESWILGNKGVSEDWDDDFEFDEPPRPSKQLSTGGDIIRSASGMLVPPSIMERQASVHGQFGQVKELTLLVEELKRLQQQASAQGIMQGQSAELWKEAEGIINLATLDDEEQELFPPRSPRSPSNEHDPFEEDSPATHGRRKSDLPPPGEASLSGVDNLSKSLTPSRPTPDRLRFETPPTSRPRRESAAKAKSVLETIHQQRNHYSPNLLDSKSSQKKLPFDTTSLRDLVTRAGVVTRALKEIVRRAEESSLSPRSPPSTPQDPPYTHMFQNPLSSLSVGNKMPRVSQSPKNSDFLGGSIPNNDNEINGHMKMMTVV